MKILLDTNFIITCAKQKIDYERMIHGITDEDVTWIVPQEVLTELRGLLHGRSNGRGGDLDAIELGLEIVSRMNIDVVKISDTNTDVDTMIVNYIRDTPIVLATLDKGLKDRVKNRILTVRGKKGLEIV